MTISFDATRQSAPSRTRLLLCLDEVVGGLDVSPSLRWSGAPVGTLSYVVTAGDCDGRCHWAVADVSGGVTALVVDAGNGTGERLPSLAKQLLNDFGITRYVGPSPAPPGVPGLFMFTVHAVDIARLPLDIFAGPTRLHEALDIHSLGRATLTTTHGRTPPVR